MGLYWKERYAGLVWEWIPDDNPTPTGLPEGASLQINTAAGKYWAFKDATIKTKWQQDAIEGYIFEQKKLQKQAAADVEKNLAQNKRDLDWLDSANAKKHEILRDGEFGLSFKERWNNPVNKASRKIASGLWYIAPGTDLIIDDIITKVDPVNEEDGDAAQASIRGTSIIINIVLNPVGAAKGAASKLSSIEKDALRERARDIWQAANKGRRAIWDGLRVHHRIPLEWSHLMPGDPNRLANLVGVKEVVHKEINAAWAAFKKSLNGRLPTPSEIMKKALEIDEKFAEKMVFPR